MSTRLAAVPWLNGIQAAVAANLANIAVYMVFLLLPSDVPAQIRTSGEFLITTFISTVVGLIGGYIGAHMRDSQWAETSAQGHGKVTGIKTVLPVFACLALLPLLVLASGCASYDRAALSASATQFAPATAVSADECDALSAASEHVVAGPDSASYITGKAQALKALSPLFVRHAVQCERAVTLGAEGASTERVQGAFSRSWRKLQEVIE